MSLARHNPKRDRNERALVAALGAVPGVIVHRISGPGIPDLLVGHRKRYVLLEIKSKRGRLEPLQVAFHDTARALGLPCYVVTTIDEALAALGIA